MKSRTLILLILSCFCSCANYREEISELQREIDSIKNEKISSINEQIKNINTSISELNNYRAGLDDYIKDLQEQDILLKEAIEEVKSNNGNAEISVLEDRLTSVEETLATLQDLYESLDAKIVDLRKYVDEEISEIENGIKDWANATYCTLEQYYEETEAISVRISDVKSELEALTDRVRTLETQVVGISSELDEMISEIDSIKKSIEEILSMIQSITVVPDNSDGSVDASCSTRATVDFEIFPLSAAEALAENWSGAVSLQAVYTKPVTKSSHTFVDLTVSDVFYADGIVTVMYDSKVLCNEYWLGHITANARLLISDGMNCAASQYYLLRPVLLDFSMAEDLSSAESANCYIVSSAGQYKFKSVKGNSTASLGNVFSCEVLWESFGTSTTPQPGDLIPYTIYKDGYIYFESSSNKGNAVIAAKDAYGNILWSWHLWLTDEPQAQVYNNNAGTMLDRNLGATSATPGDVGSLGLLYQWGRKDPFLGACQIDRPERAQSTGVWEDSEESISNELTLAHPMTFYYGRSGSLSDVNWRASKTKYDPCPPGWRVPSGGESGIWTKAGFSNSIFDDSNKGISFVTESSGSTWFPASGIINSEDANLSQTGNIGGYWSVTVSKDISAYMMRIDSDCVVSTAEDSNRSNGLSVRCMKVGESGLIDWGDGGTVSGGI